MTPITTDGVAYGWRLQTSDPLEPYSIETLREKSTRLAGDAPDYATLRFRRRGPPRCLLRAAGRHRPEFRWRLDRRDTESSSGKASGRGNRTCKSLTRYYRTGGARR